jgi:hypothetical protein
MPTMLGLRIIRFRGPKSRAPPPGKPCTLLSANLLGILRDRRHCIAAAHIGQGDLRAVSKPFRPPGLAKSHLQHDHRQKAALQGIVQPTSPKSCAAARINPRGLIDVSP